MRAQIASKQAKFTLLRLHAELGGKIKDNKAEAARLAKAMMHVEAVLKLLEPGYDVRPIAVRRRKVNPWFKRGTMLRAALDVLRGAEKPISAREVAVQMLAAKGVVAPSTATIRTLYGGVKSVLDHYKGRSVIASGQNPVVWAIKP